MDRRGEPYLMWLAAKRVLVDVFDNVFSNVCVSPRCCQNK